MQTLELTWRFILANPATPYLLPIPWHLLAVLIFLGLLAAVGLHHLLGYTFRLYIFRGKAALWVAVPSLIILLVSVQIILAGYLTITKGPALVKHGLRTDQTVSYPGRIGAELLEPAFGPLGDRPEEQIGSKGQVAEMLMSVPTEEMREGLAQKLASVLELLAISQQGEAETSPPEEAEIPQEMEPALPEDGTKPAETAAGGDSGGDPPPETGTVGDSGESSPPEEGSKPPENIAGGDSAGDPAGDSEDSAAPEEIPESAPPDEVSPEIDPAAPAEEMLVEGQHFRGLLILSLGWAVNPEQTWPGGRPGSINYASDPFALEEESEGEEEENADSTEEEEDQSFPLPAFLASLVDEINESAILSRQDWEHVAGKRFMERVLEPLLNGQILLSGIILLVLVFLFDILYFFLLYRLRRGLEPRPKAPA